MERKIATAELTGFFQRELKNQGLTLSDAQRVLKAGPDQGTDPQRVGHLLDEITELIRDHGPDTPVGDFLPDEPSTPRSPGIRG